MRVGLTLSLGILAIGCSQERHSPMPREADIQRLEARLANHPCVGELDGWERNYRYKRTASAFWTDNTDFSVIEFHFRQAGTITLAPVRRIIGPDNSADWPDSRAIRSVSGVFNTKSGTARLAKCRRESGRDGTHRG